MILNKFLDKISSTNSVAGIYGLMLQKIWHPTPLTFSRHGDELILGTSRLITGFCYPEYAILILFGAMLCPYTWFQSIKRTNGYEDVTIIHKGFFAIGCIAAWFTFWIAVDSHKYSDCLSQAYNALTD